MKLANALSNFLYDKNYFVTIFDSNIHIYKYLELIKLTSNVIVLRMDGFDLQITGEDLTIIQMNKEELLITGKVLNIGKNYA